MNVEKGNAVDPSTECLCRSMLKGPPRWLIPSLQKRTNTYEEKMTLSTKSGEGVEKDKHSAKTDKVCAEKDKFRSVKKVPKPALHLVKPGNQQNQTTLAPYFF